MQCFLENGDFDRVLDLIKQPPHDINVNELYDSGLTPLHLATAGGALVSGHAVVYILCFVLFLISTARVGVDD